MGNSCECVRRQSSDEAEDALLASLVGEGSEGGPRGPPPPYQPQAPVYNYPVAAMSEEHRSQLIHRITIIQSLPCVQYELRSEKEKKKEPRECAICMMDYSAGDRIRLLPCMHYYHLHCIDDWLMRSLTCPTCMERVDRGLVTTLHTARTSRNPFSLRRRHRPLTPSSSSSLGGSRGGSGSTTPLVSAASRSSSRSSSTSSSSSTDQLMTPSQLTNSSHGSQPHALPQLQPFLHHNINANIRGHHSDLGPPPHPLTPPPSSPSPHPTTPPPSPSHNTTFPSTPH